jgi:hypothetical protein
VTMVCLIAVTLTACALVLGWLWMLRYRSNPVAVDQERAWSAQIDRAIEELQRNVTQIEPACGDRK